MPEAETIQQYQELLQELLVANRVAFRKALACPNPQCLGNKLSAFMLEEAGWTQGEYDRACEEAADFDA